MSGGRVGVVLVAAALVAACGVEGPLASATAVDSPASDPVPSRSPGASEQATPSASLEPRVSALEALQCDGPPSEVGGLGEDWGGPSNARSPEDALRQFISLDFFDKPVRGYVAAQVEPDRVLFVYVVAGRPRVALDVRTGVMGDEGWGVFDYRTCDASEFAPADLPPDLVVWTDAMGRPVPRWRVNQLQGPRHCDWQSTTWLHIHERPRDPKWRQYIRDPEGVMEREWLLDEYGADVELPPDAVDTGLRRGDARLFAVPDDRSVYLVLPGRVERWPRSREPIGCA